MNLLCPICRGMLASTSVCAHGHEFSEIEGVLQLMRPEFEQKLMSWLTDFEKFRDPQIHNLDFNTLPKSGIKFDPFTWKARCLDLQIIQSFVPGKNGIEP